MFNFLLNSKFMKYYSIFMIFWFTIGRAIALYLTDDVAWAFFKNPITFIIANITVFYAIMVYKKYRTFNVKMLHIKQEFFEGGGAILGLIHSYFMIYRAYILYCNNVFIDSIYLILDILFVLYFVMVCIMCWHANSNHNAESNLITNCN